MVMTQQQTTPGARRPGSSIVTAAAFKGMQVYFEMVTPAMAKAWLGSNVHNRALSPWRVDQYAATMKRGDWMPTCQGIGFDKDWNIIDGQNRLTAIVESGVATPLLIVFGLDPRSQLVTDMGLPRRIHDQLKLTDKYDVTARHIAIARQMHRSVRTKAFWGKVDPLQDIQIFERFYSQVHKAVEFSIEAFGKKNIKGVTLSAVMAVVARAYFTADRNRLLEFGKAVATGFMPRKSDSAAIELRNWLLSHKPFDSPHPRNKMEMSMIYRGTEEALFAFMKTAEAPNLAKTIKKPKIGMLSKKEKEAMEKLIRERFPLPEQIRYLPEHMSHF